MTTLGTNGLTLTFTGKIYFRILGLGLALALALGLWPWPCLIGLALVLALTPLALLTSLPIFVQALLETRRFDAQNFRKFQRLSLTPK